MSLHFKDIDRIRALWHRGYTTLEIAAAIPCDKNTATKYKPRSLKVRDSARRMTVR